MGGYRGVATFPSDFSFGYCHRSPQFPASWAGLRCAGSELEKRAGLARPESEAGGGVRSGELPWVGERLLERVGPGEKVWH